MIVGVVVNGIMSEKIILGIDPGTTVMGYGLIKVVNNEMKFLLLNELDLKISTNYDILSVVPNYNANISISNSF